jgi:hypothetical protein
MSANRDKSQKVTFVYSNLYSIYRKGLERAREGATLESEAGAPSKAAQALTELAVGQPARPRVPEAFQSGIVIKPGDLRSPSHTQAPASVTPPPAPPRVTPYTPAELIGKRVARPASITPTPAAAATQAKPASPDAVQSLKQNLESLNDLQARLRFMLKELEDLIKE